MIVSIHQPENMPWLGFFDKLRQSDMFILLDNVQFRKNYFQNRNKIRTATGWQWLTVPITSKSLMKPINEVRVNNITHWQRPSWQAIQQNYHRTEHWDLYAPFFENIYSIEWERLVDLNVAIIKWVVEQLGIRTRLILGSTLAATGHSTALLLAQCQELGATTYLSGQFGREYLDTSQFENAGIEVRFHSFNHPVYQQVYSPFEPGMSAIDLLFNAGPESLAIIEGANQ